jgi:predicted MFS family arabinose efflux permease
MAVEAKDFSAGASAQPHEFPVTETYRRYVVWFLFVVYTFNFVDRQILSILGEDVKREFSLSDSQLGLLTGFAFAAFYTTLGIPIARWADKGNRVNIISISLIVWSAFTAVTGLARNFYHLLAARVLVGIGEAGCSPAAHSVISDYFDSKTRSRALSIYSMGVYGGTFLGLLIGGQVAHRYGWRSAFFLVGLPGILLALALKLTIREPPRGFADGVVPKEPPPFWDVLRKLVAKPTFRHLSVASGLHAFVSYGVSAFYGPYLIRSHGFNKAEAGTWLAFIVGIGGLLGTYLGGTYADKLAQRYNDSRYLLKVPAISNLIALPFCAIAFWSPSYQVALVCIFFYISFGTMYLAPSISATYRLVSARERALASASLFLVLNFIGIGTGPWVTGHISDLLKDYFVANGATVAQATADGLRYALVIIAFTFAWSTFHYYRANRTLRQEEAK